MGINDQIRKITEVKIPTAEESLAGIDTKVSTKTEQVLTNEKLQEQLDNSPLTDAELRASSVGVDTGLLQGLTLSELNAAEVAVTGPITESQMQTVLTETVASTSSPMVINQYTQQDTLNLILDELQQINKTLKKIYQ